MTDKQIIIDGCDVSECKYFSKYQKIVRNNECIVDIQNACVEEIKTKPCSQKHNCYFKNWQRKEQECEKWKNAYEVKEDALTESEEEYEELEEQRNKLKAKNKELKKQFESTKGLAKIRYQCLEAVKELTKNANLPNISLYIDSFLNKEP